MTTNCYQSPLIYQISVEISLNELINKCVIPDSESINSKYREISKLGIKSILFGDDSYLRTTNATDKANYIIFYIEIGK